MLIYIEMYSAYCFVKGLLAEILDIAIYSYLFLYLSEKGRY